MVDPLVEGVVVADALVKLKKISKRLTSIFHLN